MGVNLEGGWQIAVFFWFNFFVKRPLIRDCLAGIALHETQLKRDSRASLAEERIGSGSHLPVEKLVIPSPPLKISPPTARPSASYPEHSKGSIVGTSGRQWQDIEEHTIGARVSFCGVVIPSIFKYLLINYYVNIASRKEEKKTKHWLKEEMQF